MSKKAYSSQDIIDLLKNAGFVLDRIKGSHHIFFHPQSKKRALFHTPKKIYLLEQRGLF
jgi:predicted RNA binding protein YcfA (HicA-like mRNA interferase family)